MNSDYYNFSVGRGVPLATVWRIIPKQGRERVTGMIIVGTVD